MALGFARINHVWNNPTVGTGPFVTGLWMVAPGGATEEQFEGICGVVADAWNDHLDTIFSDNLGAGTLVGQYLENAIVFDHEQSLSAAEGDGGNFGAGYSVRVVLGGARPAGGRPNQMYWPLPDESVHASPGVPTAGVQTAFTAWATQLLDETETGAWSWANRHYVDNDDHDPSWSNVTGANVASTFSWLQRRYR